MNIEQTIQYINSGMADNRLTGLYGQEQVTAQKERYLKTLKKFFEKYGEREVMVFSTPGRSELSGNHTDHNHGCVVAASLNIDIIAVVSPRKDNVINVSSDDFGTNTVNIAEFSSPDKKMFGTSESLIAGMCAYIKGLGSKIGGFDAYTDSAVPKGSGLSSSAAYEDLIGCIENHLYNNGIIDNVEIAKLSQKAENNFFGKPCGLMDQVACAVGGIVAIDFCDPAKPVIRPVPFDLSAAGYNLCIVNTGGNHADLTDDYASVPAEMKSVAKMLGKEFLRDCDEGMMISKIPEIRAVLGDRAVLRALHFFGENKRVLAQTEALLNNDIDTFLQNVKASGRSSFCYLQNVYTVKDVTCQGLSIALCLAEKALDSVGGAWRVHGGGFAGTIQAFVPVAEVAGFKALMDSVFGDGACLVLRVRADGAVKVF